MNNLCFTHCKSCETTYMVVGRDEEIQRLIFSVPEWQHSLPCVTPRCGGRSFRVQLTDVVGAITEVPALAYYKSLLGFGPPNGAPAAAAKVRELLLAHRVVDCRLSSIGSPERTIVKSLTLVNGTVLHFEASDQGACIFYAEVPFERSDVAAQAATARGNSSGDEVGSPSRADEGRQDVASDDLEGRGVPSVSSNGGVHPDGSV